METVRRLAQFLGVEASDQLCQDIADACSFQKMKQADKDKTLPEGTILPMKQQIYRKGEVVPSPPGYTRIPAAGKVRVFLVFPIPAYPLQKRCCCS